MRIADFFCGIGGVAEAARVIASAQAPAHQTPDQCPDPPRVVAAIDIDARISELYRINHGVVVETRTIESLQHVPPADTWWLSPPCQPYTIRGAQRHETDTRSLALEQMFQLIRREKPSKLLLENVPRFEGSVHHKTLVELLGDDGYVVRGDLLCPTQWGIPMRRERFYLRARRDCQGVAEVNPQKINRPIADFINPDSTRDELLFVTEATLKRYQPAMRILDEDNHLAIASCFTSAYGSSPVRAGSYLRVKQSGRVRRFSPDEIANLMGYRDRFYWPPSFDARIKYQLLGNALPVPVVADLLRSIL